MTAKIAKETYTYYSINHYTETKARAKAETKGSIQTLSKGVKIAVTAVFETIQNFFRILGNMGLAAANTAIKGYNKLTGRVSKEESTFQAEKVKWGKPTASIRVFSADDAIVVPATALPAPPLETRKEPALSLFAPFAPIAVMPTPLSEVSFPLLAPFAFTSPFAPFSASSSSIVIEEITDDEDSAFDSAFSHLALAGPMIEGSDQDDDLEDEVVAPQASVQAPSATTTSSLVIEEITDNEDSASEVSDKSDVADLSEVSDEELEDESEKVEGPSTMRKIASFLLPRFFGNDKKANSPKGQALLSNVDQMD